MKTTASHLAIVASIGFSVAFPGCILDAMDRARFPVWVDNNTNEAVEVNLKIIDIEENRTVYNQTLTIPPGEGKKAKSVNLPVGNYAVIASANGLENRREDLLGSSHTNWGIVVNVDSIESYIGLT